MDKAHMELTNDEVAANLTRFGAPLFGDEAGGDLNLEEALALGVRLSRQSDPVARVWPVAFARNAHALDVQKLVSLATELGEKQACGYLLSVTGKLMGDQALVSQAEAMREERPEPEYFFQDPDRCEALGRLERRKTDDFGKRWSFWTGAPVDLFFETCYRKHMNGNRNKV